MKKYSLLCTIFSAIVFFSFIGNTLHAQIRYKIPDEKPSENSMFADPKNKTSTTSQAIYEQGGQSDTYRLTESEKALDFLKKELASIKNELALVRSEVESLKSQKLNADTKNDVKSPPIATPSLEKRPSKIPTPY